MGLVLGRRRPPTTLLIFSMWVDPAVRRAGIGGRLIATAERWAVGWGARESALWVFAANEPALRFYVRIGYGIDQRPGRTPGRARATAPSPCAGRSVAARG